MAQRAQRVAALLSVLVAACGPLGGTASPTPKPLAVITITSPAAGSTVAAGDVTVTFEISDVTLVPAASAQKPEDYHAHAALDLDTSRWVGTSEVVPAASANPNPDRLIHTAAKSVTFPKVTAGEHTVTVWLSFSTHVSVRPAVSAVVKFTTR